MLEIKEETVILSKCFRILLPLQLLSRAVIRLQSCYKKLAQTVSRMVGVFYVGLFGDFLGARRMGGRKDQYTSR